MAYTYRLNLSRSRVVVTGGRQWSGADLLASRREAVSAPDFAPSFDWVYDCAASAASPFLPPSWSRPSSSSTHSAPTAGLTVKVGPYS